MANMIFPTSLGFLLATCAAFAQTSGSAPSFEVASVKPAAPIASKEGKERVGVTVSGTRVAINSTPLAELVQIAYRVKPYQVTGAEWTGTDRFDVLARMPDGATGDQMPEMLQTLLADRFKLTLRREHKEHAVYALLVGKNGLKLEEAGADPDPPPSNNAKKSVSHLDRNMTMAGFADFLGRFLDRPVADMTGTKEAYHIVMDLPIDDLIKAKTKVDRPGNAADAKLPAADSASDPAGLAIFGIVRKFGLTLEPRKAPMELLVIDHAERIPTAN